MRSTGANLTQADLRGALYDVDTCLKLGFLKDAKIGAVDWSGKDLSGAQMPGCDLQGSTLTGCIGSCMNLEGANLRSTCFDGTTLTQANLRSAVLLNWSRTHHSLETSKSHMWCVSSLEGCDMTDCDMRDATYDVEGCAQKEWLVAAKVGQVKVLLTVCPLIA